jgi:hypothetical protein
VLELVHTGPGTVIALVELERTALSCAVDPAVCALPNASALVLLNPMTSL